VAGGCDSLLLAAFSAGDLVAEDVGPCAAAEESDSPARIKTQVAIALFMCLDLPVLSCYRVTGSTAKTSTEDHVASVFMELLEIEKPNTRGFPSRTALLNKCSGPCYTFGFARPRVFVGSEIERQDPAKSLMIG